MCRLYALRATADTHVHCDLMLAPNALVRQSACDTSGECHSDGWGVVYYDLGWPQRVRGTAPAFDDAAFPASVEALEATTVLAHVRSASVGDRSLVNTHPFRLGCWVFAHNGTVAALDRLGDKMVQETLPEWAALRSGSTDSEAAFLWLLSRLSRDGLTDFGTLDVSRLRRAVAAAVAELWTECERLEPGVAKLNFLLTNGESLVATRVNHTLHASTADLRVRCSICGREHAHAQPGTEYRCARLASEPLADVGWQEIPDRSVVSIDRDARLTVEPLV